MNFNLKTLDTSKTGVKNINIDSDDMAEEERLAAATAVFNNQGSNVNPKKLGKYLNDKLKVKHGNNFSVKREASQAGGLGKKIAGGGGKVKNKVQQSFDTGPDAAELQKKMDTMQLAHQGDMKNIKILAKKFTVDFFRSKCENLCDKLTDESNKNYNAFDSLRSKYFKEQARVNSLLVQLVQ